MPTRLSVRWLVVISVAIVTLVIAAMASAILIEGEVQSEDTDDTSVGGLWASDVGETPGRTRVYPTDGPAERGTIRKLAQPGNGMLLAHNEYVIWHDSGSDWANGEIRVFQSDSGDELWSRPMKGTGTYPAAYQDSLYIVTPTDVKRLDLATGKESSSYPHGFEADWVGNEFNRGSASDLAISDGRIFILFDSGSMASGDHRSLVVLDHDTGEELWSKVLPGARAPSLFVSDDVVVASELPFLGNGTAQAWAIENGDELWQLVNAPGFDQLAVMAVSGDTAIIRANPDKQGSEPRLGALDLASGNERWFVDEEMGFCDDVVHAVRETTLYLYCGSGVVGVDLGTGSRKSTSSRTESLGREGLMLIAGDHAYLCDESGMDAIDLSTGAIAWSHPDAGECITLAVADDVLYWLGTDGAIWAMDE